MRTYSNRSEEETIGFFLGSLGYRMTIGVSTQLFPGSSLRRYRNRAVDGGEAQTQFCQPVRVGIRGLM